MGLRQRAGKMPQGMLAKTLGMKAPPKTISGDGYRLQTKGKWLMMAGEGPGSWGCAPWSSPGAYPSSGR